MAPQVPPGSPGSSGPPGTSPRPPGLTGPFVNLAARPLPERAILLVTPVTIFYSLAIVCIGLRIWSKIIKKNSIRFSDYAIFVAAIFATGYLSICWLVVERGGVGYPLIKVAPSARKLTQQSFIVAWLIQAWGNTFVRLSILDLFATIFRISKYHIVVYFFEGLAIAYLVGCTITFFAICRPMKYNWEIGPQSLQHCGNLNMKFLLSSIFNLFLDVSILILPMPMLWTLQLNARKKVALTVVFGLGIFVCFATAWRTYHVVKFSKPSSKMNFTITIVEDALWSGLEINLGIINACLPVMPPALQKIFGVPLNRLLTITSTWRPFKSSSWGSSKPSKLSSTGRSGTSNTNAPFNPGPAWQKLDNNSTKSKHGITQEYTIDIEEHSAEGIPMDNIGDKAWKGRSAGV
ncbi:hypothetical protein CC80DRAFT_456784 [Byssothecium circinans]|uniref:Rhodopsin domain-containing protein n=1 Tax=Byssothecium circinans TaxID=147558 RepID=A0A6A5TCD1_9PLEO|nr:hypothetical protein CC80DRAFT_456784 [Byssothecium circinans]